ncbi:MAG: hypothetical protein K9H15_15315, partial [Bacteroidales bacterium]|nr:hypothetical protein [Bacteroidales bacterium]
MKKNIKVYIHVGFHKTGTTAIQHFLNMNYKNLIKQGILYPLEIRLMFEKARYAHHGIAWYFGFGGDLTPIDEIRNMGIGAKQILESLHKEINQNKKKSVIISSEVFSENFDEKKFCKVFDLFSGFSVYVIYYIRRQDNYVISDFKHRVTHFGYSQPIEEMLGRQNLDYYNRIKFISNLLGKENIFVRVYEEVDPAGSIFEDLLSCVGGRLNKSFKFPPKLQSNR